MNQVEIQLWDACSADPFAGSPTGVVLEARMIRDEHMQLLASELHLPCTVFVLGGNAENQHLRFFSPATELDLSVHGAVAALTALARAGKLPLADRPRELNLLTRAGKLPAQIRPRADASPEIVVDLPALQRREFGYSLELVAGILGIDRYQIANTRPKGLCSVGAWTLVIPVESGEVLDRARPDYDSLARLIGKVGAVSLLLYSFKGPGHLACRSFAPATAIPEDPVNAEAAAAAAALAVREGALDTTPPRTVLQAEQGAKLGRPARLALEVFHSQTGVDRVRVIAAAQMTMEGRMHLP